MEVLATETVTMIRVMTTSKSGKMRRAVSDPAIHPSSWKGESKFWIACLSGREGINSLETDVAATAWSGQHKTMISSKKRPKIKHTAQEPIEEAFQTGQGGFARQSVMRKGNFLKGTVQPNHKSEEGICVGVHAPKQTLSTLCRQNDGFTFEPHGELCDRDKGAAVSRERDCELKSLSIMLDVNEAEKPEEGEAKQNKIPATSAVISERGCVLGDNPSATVGIHAWVRELEHPSGDTCQVIEIPPSADGETNVCSESETPVLLTVHASPEPAAIYCGEVSENAEKEQRLGAVDTLTSNEPPEKVKKSRQGVLAKPRVISTVATKPEPSSSISHGMLRDVTMTWTTERDYSTVATSATAGSADHSGVAKHVKARSYPLRDTTDVCGNAGFITSMGLSSSDDCAKSGFNNDDYIASDRPQQGSLYPTTDQRHTYPRHQRHHPARLFNMLWQRDRGSRGSSNPAAVVICWVPKDGPRQSSTDEQDTVRYDLEQASPDEGSSTFEHSTTLSHGAADLYEQHEHCHHTVASLGHLTVREMYTFLFQNPEQGLQPNKEEWTFPSVERSSAAAAAAVMGGGYCLLQKCIDAGAERSSMLRYHWTPISPEKVDNTVDRSVMSPTASGSFSVSKALQTNVRVRSLDTRGSAGLHEPSSVESRCNASIDSREEKYQAHRRGDDPRDSTLKVQEDFREYSSDPSPSQKQHSSERPILNPALSMENCGQTHEYRGPNTTGHDDSNEADRSSQRFQVHLASEVMVGNAIDKGILRRQQELQNAKVGNRNTTGSAPGGLGEDRMPAGLLFGSAEGMKPCISMTLEEPKFSTWGSSRPKPHGKPIKTLALRETLVEACTAIADHIFQVSRSAFRPNGLTGYFQQESDGRTYLLFLSRWGTTPHFEVDLDEPLLLRSLPVPVATLRHPIANASSGLDCAPGVLVNHALFGKRGRGRSRRTYSAKNHSPDCHFLDFARKRTTQADLGDKIFQEERKIGDRVNAACPGCGGSVIDGVTRLVLRAGSTGSTDAEKAPSRSRAYRSRHDDTIQCFGLPTAKDVPTNLVKRVSGLYSTSDTATSLTVGTHYTCLGVIVDICEWKRRCAHDVLTGLPPARSKAIGTQHKGAGSVLGYSSLTATYCEERDPRHERMDQVTAGIARCSRALAVLYPSLSVEQVVERCAEDCRLRLKTVKVCRRCANEIVRASDKRLYEMNELARQKGRQVAARHRMPSPSLSRSQRKLRLDDDIDAFEHRRRKSGSAVPLHGRSDVGPHREPDKFRDEGAATTHDLLPHKPSFSARARNQRVRPITTGSITPRIKVYRHPSRMVVSASNSTKRRADSCIPCHKNPEAKYDTFATGNRRRRCTPSNSITIHSNDGSIHPPSRPLRFSGKGCTTVVNEFELHGLDKKASLDNSVKNRNRVLVNNNKVKSGFESKPSEDTIYRQSTNNRPNKCFTACKAGNTRLRSSRERRRGPHCTLDTFEVESVDIGIKPVHSQGSPAVSSEHDRRNSPRFYSARRQNSQALLKLAPKMGKRPFTSCGQRQQHGHHEQMRRGNSGRTRRDYFYAPAEIARRNREVVLIYAGGGVQGGSNMISSPRDHPETTWSSEFAPSKRVNEDYDEHRRCSSPSSQEGVRPKLECGSPRGRRGKSKTSSTGSNALQWAKMVAGRSSSRFH